MSKVVYSHFIEQDSQKIWETIVQFGKISSWHSGIKESFIEDGNGESQVNSIRHLVLGDGTSLRERLLAIDQFNLTIIYNFEETLLPIENYVMQITLVPITGEEKTVVTWSACFDVKSSHDPLEFETLMFDLIAGGHKDLAKFLN